MRACPCRFAWSWLSRVGVVAGRMAAQADRAWWVWSCSVKPARYSCATASGGVSFDPSSNQGSVCQPVLIFDLRVHGPWADSSDLNAQRDLFRADRCDGGAQAGFDYCQPPSTVTGQCSREPMVEAGGVVRQSHASTSGSVFLPAFQHAANKARRCVARHCRETPPADCGSSTVVLMFSAFRNAGCQHALGQSSV